MAEPGGPGWYVVEIDPDNRQTLAYWTRFPNQRQCEEFIRHHHIPAAWLLSARLYDGERWLTSTPETPHD